MKHYIKFRVKFFENEKEIFNKLSQDNGVQVLSRAHVFWWRRAFLDVQETAD